MKAAQVSLARAIAAAGEPRGIRCNASSYVNAHALLADGGLGVGIYRT